MAVSEYVDYLAQYCEAFDVTRHIRFGTRVESVVQNPNGDWMVRTLDAHGTHEEQYNAVTVCSGLHQHPHLPSFQDKRRLRE